MKYWWRTVVKDYFTFTGRERTGLFVLIGASVMVYMLPRFFAPEKKPVPDDSFMQEIASLKITIDSSKRSYANKYEDRSPDFSPSKKYVAYKPEKAEVFYFDPNTLNADGWKKLGIKDRTIETIDKFKAKGYAFRQPDDIRKIFGLRKEDADRLVPYVKISATAKPAISNVDETVIKPSAAPSYIAPSARTIRIIDVNNADTTAYISLPGIGSKLAARIVNFRDKLGGFTSIEQVGETFGVPDSTFQKIKSQLQCNNPALRTININEADVNTLKAHPYLKWHIANAIFNYRLQHGNYKSVDELKKIEIITDELFNKIAPYLVISQ